MSKLDTLTESEKQYLEFALARREPRNEMERQFLKSKQYPLRQNQISENSGSQEK